MSGAGKGDLPRKVDLKTYQDNYDAIFRRKTDKEPENLQVRAETDERPEYGSQEVKNDTPKP